MRKSLKALAVASAVVASLAAAPTLHAHATEDSQGSMMGPGMMGGDMMGMMSQMNAMMETCNKMMQGMKENTGPGAPNEESVQPEERG